MKKVFYVVAGLIIAFGLAVTFYSIAKAGTKQVSDYYSEGYTGEAMVQDVLDNSYHVDDQLKRRVIITNIETPKNVYAVEDSVYAVCGYVPPGSTRSMEIDSIYLFAIKEGDIDTVVDPQQFRVFIGVWDASAAALDTLVADLGLDAESLAYAAMTPYLLTQNTTNYDGQLNPGDIVLARFWAKGKWITQPEGLSIIIIGRYDE